MRKKVILVGLGPHAKRIYLNYFKKHKITLKAVIDLESKEEEIKKYLKNNGFTRTKILSIPDYCKDYQYLPQKISNNLLKNVQELKATHLIISTEPKGHNMYINFALKNNINVLTDKPITVNKNMLTKKNIKKIKNQYYKLLKLSEESSSMCKVMCQRQYHKGYEYIKKLLEEVVTTYQVPITYIDIYHCDGNWEMLHDLDKENHPYKYGYGKLFHSGYHFIDLLSDLLKINNKLPNSKKIKNGELYTNCFTPSDELDVFNLEDYKRIFKEQEIPDFYYKFNKKNMSNYGEKNFYGMLKFTNKNKKTITNVNLSLLHYGFSRRGWIQSRDYYKSNGRIRHERVNIQVGPLLNIQVHSYQSKEIKDRDKNVMEERTGGLEHFDIDIYRNTDLIGGKPFERIKLRDLYSNKDKKDFMGYNELSREQYLDHFFSGKCEKGDIKDQALAIELLYNCAIGIYNTYKNNHKVVNINMKNAYLYPITIKDLSKKSNNKSINESKVLKDIFKIYKEDGYEFGAVMNSLKDKNTNEVYMYVYYNKETATMLLYKEYNNIILSRLYFNYLKYIIRYKKTIKILKKILLIK